MNSNTSGSSSNSSKRPAGEGVNSASSGAMPSGGGAGNSSGGLPYSGATMQSGSFGWSWAAEQDDNEEDEEFMSDEYKNRYENRDSIICLIDCSEIMFTDKTDSGESPFRLALRCVKNTITTKIISGGSDLIAVVLYGVKTTKNPTNFKGINIWMELDHPDAQRVVEMDDMLASENFNNFARVFGHSTAYTMNDVFWTCANMFSTSSQKIGSRRVFIFTNEDNPHGDNAAVRTQALTKSKDLRDIGVEIELMSISKKNGQFDATKFYKDVVTGDEDEVKEIGTSSSNFDSLLFKMRRKQFKKRALMTIPLDIGGIILGTRVYNLLSETKKGSYIYLDSNTSKEVKTKSRLVCQDTASYLLPSDVKYYFPYGGEKVIFEAAEKDEIRRFGPPGLLLMGFKPRSRLKRHFQVKNANFLYPDEAVVQGSTVLFNALLQRMVAKDKIAVCRFIPRRNSPPRFCALLPQLEELDSSNLQVKPPGFHIIHLPFADDLRSLDYGENEPCSIQEVDLAKQVVKKLTFEFSSLDFENPTLQKHYRALEALALNKDEPDDFVNTLEPDLAGIEQRAGKEIQRFQELVFPPEYNADTAGSKPMKRSSESSGAKRVKLDPNEPMDVKKYFDNDALDSLTIPILKSFLKENGIKTTSSAKKGDLVESVKRHFGKQ